MSEQSENVVMPYTHTYDRFTVFFYGDRVFVGKKDYPIGQCCVDIMGESDAVLDEIEQRVKELIPAAQALLTEGTGVAADAAQEKLNAVWDTLFALPVYRDLNMDDACNYQTFQRLMADSEKWAQVREPGSEGYAIYQGMLSGFAWFTPNLRSFRQQIAAVTEHYFEPMKRRSVAAYAEAYSYFYSRMKTMGAFLGEDFEQSFPMEAGFVPMLHPTRPGDIFVAEKDTFNRLTDFLLVEFYRALSIGNAPRRCHNCGRYFLLTEGYNTCYCNNIAPGEAKRTCRKVGAHRKEAQGKANRTPAQKEYDRTYNRLKRRKQRGKISADEWNAAVAQAQELVEQSHRGELTDEELKARLEAL